MARVRTLLVPQPFVAATEIFPDVDPAVAFIDVVVDDPVHPEGSDHE